MAARDGAVLGLSERFAETLRSGVLSEDLQAFCGSEHLHGSDDGFREVPRIASDEYRMTGSCDLEKGEIIGVWKSDREWVRNDGDTAALEKVQHSPDLIRGQMKLWT